MTSTSWKRRSCREMNDRTLFRIPLFLVLAAGSSGLRSGPVVPLQATQAEDDRTFNEFRDRQPAAFWPGM